MPDALDPSSSPSELNATPRVRRLSKLPAIIIIGVAALVVSLLGYSILTRGQPKEVNDDEVANESSEFGTTIASANDIIQNMDRPLSERPAPKPSALPLKSSVGIENPRQKLDVPNDILEPPEIRGVPRIRSAANSIPVPRSADELAADEFARKVARAKEQLLLEALSSKTASASAPNNERAGQFASITSGRSSSATSGRTSPSSGRDRAGEQQQIRERLAAQQQQQREQQPSLDFERIENLLSTIVKNTNQQAPPKNFSNRAQGSVSRPMSQDLAARLEASSALAERLEARPQTSQGLASRPRLSQYQQTGKLSQAQKDLLDLASNAPAGTFVEATRQYGYSTETQRDQLTKTDLRVGTIIPAILINGINSELEGVAIGQVSQNVWDSTYGKQVLIPQGTRLIGEFKSDIKEGQSRVGVSWNRLQFPNGKTLSLSNMVGSDQAGFTGFSDKINNHYKKKFGSATLLSIISGVASMFTSDKNSSSGEAFTNQVSQQYATVGSKLIEKNLDIPPTIIIRPGYRFTVIVTKDFALEPYY